MTRIWKCSWTRSRKQGASAFRRQTQRRAGRTSGAERCAIPMRKADTLWCRNWISRSGGVKGLVDLVNELEAQKERFQSITDGIDTKTPAGRFFFT